MSARPENLSHQDALDRLKAGNLRASSNSSEYPRSNAARRAELVGGQRPFVTVLACADSRVAPELVFDEGLGDLFVIRVAGNIIDDAILGSIEYAGLHLGVNLVVVMGHQSCGAVTAAVDNVDVQGPATNCHVDSLIDAIRPAVQKGADNVVDASIRANAQYVADGIANSQPVLAGLADAGMRVAPAYYSLETGEVHWL
ncbi:MAG: carbonic anhydrase [Rickettsiales bacterium]|nr:carbonic anhydrase [Rickettsiales bacterium]